MSWLGLTLVLAAACCHALWNFFVKRIGGGPELVWLFSLGSVVVYLPLAIVVLSGDRPELGAREALFIAGSALLHLGYFLLLQQGYRRGELSVVYPTARATGPFLSTGFAVAFLGEQLTAQILAGALAIVVGVLFLTGSPKSAAPRVVSSVAFGLGAGFLIGSYTVWDAYAVSVLLIPPLLVDYVSSVGRVVILLPYAAKRGGLIKEHWQKHRVGVLCIAVFNPPAYILVLYALKFTPVILVAPTREVSVLITVAMGAIFLKEGHLRQRLAWAAVIVAGVALIATG